MHLLRIKRTVPRSQTVRLDLISGGWLRDIYSNTYPSELLSDAFTELHVVVRLKGGKLVSVPLLGMQGTVFPRRRGVFYAAELLSKLSGVPLERIEESTAFFNPYPKMRERLRNGLCPICAAKLPQDSGAFCPQCGTATSYDAGPA